MSSALLFHFKFVFFSHSQGFLWKCYLRVLKKLFFLRFSAYVMHTQGWLRSSLNTSFSSTPKFISRQQSPPFDRLTFPCKIVAKHLEDEWKGERKKNFKLKNVLKKSANEKTSGRTKFFHFFVMVNLTIRNAFLIPV